MKKESAMGGAALSVPEDANIADAQWSYTYDAENRIKTASGMSGGPYCYAYDGDGVRVAKAHANGGLAGC